MSFSFDTTLSLGCAAGVYKFLDWCDGNLRPESKRELTSWLTNHSSNLPANVFASLIDRIFGPKVWSAGFVLGSCATGLLALSLVLLLYIRSTAFRPDIIDDVIPLFGLYAVASLGPTYASLIISRSIVRSIAAHTTKARTAGLVCLDFLLKIALGTITIYLGSLVLNIQSAQAWSEAWKAVTSFYGHEHSLIPFTDRNGTTYGLLYYPIFFTSIWIWLYALSGVLTKLVTRIDPLYRVLISHLDVDNHPLRSAGLVLALLIFLLVLCVSPLMYITALLL